MPVCWLENNSLECRNVCNEARLVNNQHFWVRKHGCISHNTERRKGLPNLELLNQNPCHF